MDSMQQFNSALLNMISDCHYNHDAHLLERFGVTMETARQIATLSSSVKYKLAKHKTVFIDIRVNVDALNNAINNSSAASDRDELYDIAIRLGASKSTMSKMCSMSSHQFSHRRSALNIKTARARPRSLTEDEEIQLDNIHHNDCGDKDRLATLIHLSEQSGVEINRIYTYYLKTKLEVAEHG